MSNVVHTHAWFAYTNVYIYKVIKHASHIIQGEIDRPVAKGNSSDIAYTYVYINKVIQPCLPHKLEKLTAQWQKVIPAIFQHCWVWLERPIAIPKRVIAPLWTKELSIKFYCWTLIFEIFRFLNFLFWQFLIKIDPILSIVLYLESKFWVYSNFLSLLIWVFL